MDSNLAATQFHHVSYSVRDIQKSEDFYANFGFKCFKNWHADDKSLEIRHLSNQDKIVIELFCFTKNARVSNADIALEDDLMQLGLKHIAFRVKDIKHYRETLLSTETIKNATQIKQGRTDILYFFIRDPDGNFVEIVQDDRLYTHPT